MGARRSLRKREDDDDNHGSSTNQTDRTTSIRGGKKGENDSQGSGPAKKGKTEGRTRAPEKWRVPKMAEDYVNLVGDLMYPKVSFGPYGYDLAKGELPLERPNTLGVVMCPSRRRMVMEHWSPYEVACFEGAIMLVGKNFYEIGKIIRSKSTKDCIEFYYMWKMTSHYRQWKQSFEPLDPHPFSIAAPDE